MTEHNQYKRKTVLDKNKAVGVIVKLMICKHR